MKPDKALYIICADFECLVKKIDGYSNNPAKSSAVKIGEHIPCGYSMSTIWGFGHIKDKNTLYYGKDSTKKFCKSLREHAKSVIGSKKKKMLPRKNKELKSY